VLPTMTGTTAKVHCNGVIRSECEGRNGKGISKTRGEVEKKDPPGLRRGWVTSREKKENFK